MAAGLLTSGLVVGVFYKSVGGLVVGVVAILVVAVQWWRDVGREAALLGDHTMKVQFNMRWGMALFIVSEVMFFFSFFWAWFNMSLSVGLEAGWVWPPVGVESFNPFMIPLLNTTILLTSGLSVTWAHHCVLGGWYDGGVLGLVITVGLGWLFTIIQGYEYMEAPFTFADSVYGSCFFVATGFHGLHVVVGSMFLLWQAGRMACGEMSVDHHFGLEGAAWYWHFVDVVWIWLFVSVYWWGG